MLTRLPQIRTITGTIKRHLTLFATTLWANASVNGWTKAFLLANFTDGATQIQVLLFSIITPERPAILRYLAIGN
jgi:hypothetical protein